MKEQETFVYFRFAFAANFKAIPLSFSIETKVKISMDCCRAASENTGRE
jgi:hypothetical protein